MKKTAIFIWVIFFSVFKLYAQDFTGADTGAEFLKFGVGGRESAMGETYDARKADIFSTYWNPAGIARIDRMNTGVMHSKVSETSSLEYLGFGMPAAGGGFAASGHLMLYDEEPRIDEEGEEAGHIFWQERAFSVYYGKSFTTNLAGGVGAKFIQKVFDGTGLDKITGEAFAVDGGIIYNYPGFNDRLNLGASVINLGQKIKMGDQPKSDDLPRTVRIGGSYEYDNLLFTGELNKILDDSWRPGVGVEYTVASEFFLRTGYYSRAGNLGGLTLGVGIISGNFSLDWASLPAGEMLEVSRENRISIKFNF
ncbi:MAG: PorV/PorQ family protein [Elusimicrobiota bacterium]